MYENDKYITKNLRARGIKRPVNGSWPLNSYLKLHGVKDLVSLLLLVDVCEVNGILAFIKRTIQREYKKVLEFVLLFHNVTFNETYFLILRIKLDKDYTVRYKFHWKAYFEDINFRWKDLP